MELNRTAIECMFDYLNIDDSIHKTHSIKVANLALRICLKLNLNINIIKDIYYSSLLHDIGQVTLPETIFEKPENLNYKEFTLVKTHVLKTIAILQTLDIDERIIEIIKYHHERLDGTGYPYETKAIPFETQILIVADVVDAMLSIRPYRQGRDLQYVSDILSNHNKFNKIAASICLEIINNSTDYFELPEISFEL